MSAACSVCAFRSRNRLLPQRPPEAFESHVLNDCRPFWFPSRCTVFMTCDRSWHRFVIFVCISSSTETIFPAELSARPSLNPFVNLSSGISSTFSETSGECFCEAFCQTLTRNLPCRLTDHWQGTCNKQMLLNASPPNNTNIIRRTKEHSDAVTRDEHPDMLASNI